MLLKKKKNEFLFSNEVTDFYMTTIGVQSQLHCVPHLNHKISFVWHRAIPHDPQISHLPLSSTLPVKPRHALPLTMAFSAVAPPVVPPPHHRLRLPLNRRSLLFLSSSFPLTGPLISSSAAGAAVPPQPDTTVTDRVFLDFSFCPSYFLSRTLGENDLTLCPDAEPLGRLVLGLYGNLVPITVSNFKAMCSGASGSTYKGTLVQKIFPGQFFVAGRQGRRDKGEVRPPAELVRNTETVDSRAFLLEHSRAGVVSLCLSENDDDDDLKLSPNYHNVEFLITTGPGPCPQLDSKNIVFGSVLEELYKEVHLTLTKSQILLDLNRLDVVTTIASIPTFKPGEQVRQYNDFAEFIGDGRAKSARAIWNKPLKTLYISDCGVLKVAKPTLTPTLP
ncbi:peptidyl-prolyl cis-trans isomerase [Striga asiatica]|uniref:Peptidyl-prolyl cis-trans isomerase n=1 Tax=Striga asiatica TaxID=4170 RepID=A0A5A7PWD8_STRAF|nr:peptidyl-prolyl cis-trans isomerase [Striga asiatica]